MRRILVLVLLASFAAIGLSTQALAAQKKEKGKEKKVGAAQETQVRGTVKTVDKAASTMIVRDKSGTDRIVHFDSATEWTRKTEKIDPSEFKGGVHYSSVKSGSVWGVCPFATTTRPAAAS